MDQIERITAYEEILDRVARAQVVLESALTQYRQLLPQLDALEQYYTGPEWRQDFADDEAGLLPSGLKRGVLSEDGIYDALSEHQRLVDCMTQWPGQTEGGPEE